MLPGCWLPSLEARCTAGILVALEAHCAAEMPIVLSGQFSVQRGRPITWRDSRPSSVVIYLGIKAREARGTGILQVAGELAHDVTALGEGAAAGNADEVLGVVVGEEAA